jgi:hypothetical protein
MFSKTIFLKLVIVFSKKKARYQLKTAEKISFLHISTKVEDTVHITACGKYKKNEIMGTPFQDSFGAA